MKKTIEEIFDEMKRTFAERNKAYGDSYRVTGNVLAAMFPRGLALNTPDQWNRFGAFYMVVCKMVRYAETLSDGGHVDSAHDSAVYSAILEQLTREAHEELKPEVYAKRRFIVFFKPESDLAKKYANITAYLQSEAAAYAHEVYGENVSRVELIDFVKVKEVYGLEEIK